MKAVSEKKKNTVADKNYFETENLGQLADIDRHLEFLEHMSEEYTWSKEEEKSFKSLLTATKRKQKDKLLNMSVIGEFSGGKSTFINTLLRSELLSSCSLQGTTVANTVIEYSKDYSIKLIFKKGRAKKEVFQSIEELAQKVDEYTTDPEFTQNLKSVEIGIPSQKIKKIFRIIDTPGTNSLDLWHEDVTKSALRELSDISVILVDSTKLFPESLCSFVNTNLEKILPQCAFVLTKFDLIPEKERKMVLSYAKMKAESTFGLEDAFVLPFSSVAVLEGNEDNEMYKLSVESENKLLEYMAKKKTVAQLKKVISFADMLYDSAAENINTISKETEEQLELLMKTKQTDLSQFISEQKEKHTQTFLDDAHSIEADVSNDIFALATQARKNIISGIEAQASLENLKAYINNTLASDCQKEVQKISDCVEARAYELSENAGLQILFFQDEFKKKFEELQILELDFTQYEKNQSLQVPSSVRELASTQKYISDELSKENYAFFGGAAAGAVVGTAVFPVVGTVIGGIIGFFAGGFFSPDISTVKSKTINKLSPNLDAYIRESCNSITADFRKQILNLSKGIESEIDNYYSEYKETVDAKIAEEKNKQAEITNKINGIKSDLQEIRNRKHVLASVEKQIDLIGRKEN